MWFEDTVIGARRVLGSHTFTEDEIIAFAEKYDPQPFHIDPQAAKASIYGGLIASGWHTMAVWSAVAIASRKDAPRQTDGGGRNKGGQSGVSPGVSDIKWIKPVRPGTTLTFTSETSGTVDLKSRPELGLVLSHNEARDPDGELYMSFTGKGFVARKPSGG